MQRRSFLLAAAGGTAVTLGAAAGLWRWQEIPASVRYPGRTEGHFLRDRKALPAPVRTLQTDVLILGSGIAGLTAAWKLNRSGRHDFLLIDGPEPDGNAAGGQFGDLAYPTGAHYLPLPSTESFHVREILHDLGILLRNPESVRPYYDERYLLHAPEERLLIDGVWQEGLVPNTGANAEELAEQTRFGQQIEHLRNLRDSTGQRIFTLPSVNSSQDPEWQTLDQISMKSWLQQNDYRSPRLHWYVNYGCRDDYGSNYDQISAWAGLHYFCSRNGQAENADDGTWLTWPGGLQAVASGLRGTLGKNTRSGTCISLRQTAGGVEALCMQLRDGVPQTYTVQARKAICAMPLMVAARVVDNIAAFGFDPQQHLPAYAPWLVANFLMRQFPAELAEAPLSWDNVVYQEPGLGYVVSTHQDIRVQPPPKTVFSAYVALSDRSPEAARQWLGQATADELLTLASADLKSAYGWKLALCAERVDITVRGHAMVIPRPGFRSNAGVQRLREADGAILFAHADLSGFSVFEEASWWGYQAALRAMA